MDINQYPFSQRASNFVSHGEPTTERKVFRPLLIMGYTNFFCVCVGEHRSSSVHYSRHVEAIWFNHNFRTDLWFMFVFQHHIMLLEINVLLKIVQKVGHILVSDCLMFCMHALDSKKNINTIRVIKIHTSYEQCNKPFQFV